MADDFLTSLNTYAGYAGAVILPLGGLILLISAVTGVFTEKAKPTFFALGLFFLVAGSMFAASALGIPYSLKETALFYGGSVLAVVGFSILFFRWIVHRHKPVLAKYLKDPGYLTAILGLGMIFYYAYQ